MKALVLSIFALVTLLALLMGGPISCADDDDDSGDDDDDGGPDDDSADDDDDAGDDDDDASAPGVFAVGHRDTDNGDFAAIAFYDGHSWNEINTEEPDSYYYSIWGESDSNLFVLGSSHPDLENDSKWGAIWHYDGDTWQLSYRSPEHEGLFELWAASANDIYATGYAPDDSGIVLHFDGATWTPTVVTSDVPQRYLTSIWGADSNDIFVTAATDTGEKHSYVYHFNGSDWQQIADFPAGADYGHVRGFAADDVYALGYDGNGGPAIAHFDGEEWSEIDTGLAFESCNFSVSLYGLWGPSPNEFWMIGSCCTIVHYDGGDWNQVDIAQNVCDEDNWFSSIWGKSSTDIFVGSGTGVIHFDGISWSKMAGIDVEVADIWGTPTY